MGLRVLILWENLYSVIIFQLVGHSPGHGVGLYHEFTLPPVSLWFLLYAFIVEDLFSRFQSFSSMVVLQIVVILMCL